jgi:hypothetical protein
MTPAAHSVPRETDDPRNRLLDAFETLVESLIANDLEAQIRARFARLLPPEQVGPLPLTKVLTALRDIDRCRLSDAAKQRNAEARATVTKMMGAA